MVHLVMDADRTRRACDGEPYTPPTPKRGQVVYFCSLCQYMALHLEKFAQGTEPRP